MIADRSYMRQPYRPQRSATMILLIVNIVVFIVQTLVERNYHYPIVTAEQPYFNPIQKYLYLSTDGLAHGYFWQLISYQFLHGGVLHILGNSLAIFCFGRAVEEALGMVNFLKLYFISGVFGGIVQILFALAIPSHFGSAVIGASAGAMGLVATFAALFPNQRITLFIYFIIPVSMKAKVMLWLALAYTIYGMIYPHGSIAQAAHLGGILTGLIYVAWFIKGNGFNFFHRFSKAQAPMKQEPELAHAYANQRGTWRRTQKPPQTELPPAEFISREVDPILDKISAHGIHSLTQHERDVLESARKKMDKR